MKFIGLIFIIIFSSLASHAYQFNCDFIKRDNESLESHFKCGPDKKNSCVEKTSVADSIVVSVKTKSSTRDVVIKDPQSVINAYTKSVDPSVLGEIQKILSSKDKVISYKLKSAVMNSQSIYENCKFENLGKMELSYKNCSYSSVTRRVKAFARNHEDFCASTVKCGDGTSGYTVCKITKEGKCPSAEECANTDLEVPNELTMENILCRKIGAGGKVESIKSGCVPQGSIVTIEQTNGGGSYSTSSKAAK